MSGREEISPSENTGVTSYFRAEGVVSGLNHWYAIRCSPFPFNVYRYLLYPIGILYTAAQIVGYLLLPLGPLWIGVVDKAVQVALIAVLAYRFRQVRARRRV